MGNPTEDIITSTTRALSPNNFRNADEIGEGAVEAAIQSTRSSLATRAALQGSDKAVVRALMETLTLFSEHAASNAIRHGLELRNLLRISADGQKVTIRIYYVHILYRAWRARHVKNMEKLGFSGSLLEYLVSRGVDVPTNLPPSTFSQKAYEELCLISTYLRISRGEETILGKILRFALKDNYEQTLKRTPNPTRARTGWHWLHYMNLPQQATTNTLEEVAKIANSRALLSASVDSGIAHIKAVVDAGRLELPDMFMEMINAPKGSPLREALIDRLDNIFRQYPTQAGSEAVDANSLARLISSRRNVQGDQIIREMLIGVAYLTRETESIKAAYGLTEQQAKRVLDIFTSTLGYEDFFARLLRMVPNDHAYFFEQLIPLSIIGKALKEGKLLDASTMLLQTTMGGKQGIDLVMVIRRIINNAPTYLLQSFQQKSFQSLYAVIRSSSSGEALRQTTSSIDRFMREGAMSVSKLQLQYITGLNFAPQMVVNINWGRLRLDTGDAIIEEIISELPSALQAAARQLEPTEFFIKGSDELKDAIRAAFKRKYVDDYVTSLNAELVNYGTKWADNIIKDGDTVLSAQEIRERIMREFSLHNLSPDRAHWGARYMHLLDSATFDTPLKIHTELVRLYRETFSLQPGQHVEVVVELVDSKVGVNVSELVTEAL